MLCSSQLQQKLKAFCFQEKQEYNLLYFFILQILILDAFQTMTVKVIFSQ